jgi:hypothetical protein
MTTTIGNATFIFVIVCVYLTLIAGLVGFILVQIKARPIWRLLSLTVVLVGSCWFCSFSTRDSLENQYADIYGRGCSEFMQTLDLLNMEGRTNDVHQSCQNFPFYFILSTDKQVVSNFDRFVADTDELASGWTNTAPEPKVISK